MNVNKWGPGGWIFLHTITFNYPEKPTKADKKKYTDFFNMVGGMLPCKYCRDSYNKKCLSVGLRYKYSVGNQRWAVWKEASFNVPKTSDFSKSNVMDEFEGNIKEFISCKQDYYNINIPYKKTFLL